MSTQLFFILLGLLNAISTGIVVYNNVIVARRNEQIWQERYNKLDKRCADIDSFIIDAGQKLNRFFAGQSKPKDSHE